MAGITDDICRLIDNAAADGAVCLLGTATVDAKPNISPRGSVMVYDERTLAYWERSKRTAYAQVTANPQVVVYYRNANKRDLLPRGAVLKFFGTAEIVEHGPVREAVMSKVVQNELDADPERRGAAVLIHVDRITDLDGNEV